ncbi:extracellular solute-binding protein [Paenibacillus filicis]|uniref:Extracellular solute-binding protein n=1 Tax=Paenibacillus gyeongsangnamensis TaxID=3388067 RepID=A0ABT4Q2C9_9BACL|nr:extracellular solute-binding protein [Paenibacillus filicis]MCZ8511039.1 extracellular solute-binding protein [Paenibacillus filicis]
MNFNRLMAGLSALFITAGVLAGCSGSGQTPGKPGTEGSGKPAQEDKTPLEVSMALVQVGDIPAKGNAVEQAIEKYTNTKLDIQWIPNSAYDEKINVMIASGELPKIVKVNYVPTVINAIQEGLFWEVGPMLKDYKNLSAQNPQYYQNIAVEGKIYGIPLYREIGRAAVIYRKDWFDSMNLKVPKTLDEWYNVLKALTLNDPDKNGKNDTYGMMLNKKYNEGDSALLTKMAIPQGGVNRWGVDNNGKFMPEFLTPQFKDVLNLFRRLYAEKLINQDFPAMDSTEMDKQFESGRIGMKLNGVATNAANAQDRLVKVVSTAQLDTTNWEGPQGIRIYGAAGNNGFLAFPKSKVKTEAELRKLLTFLDKMMDEPMSTLQKRGFEGTHFKKLDGGLVQWTDLTAFNREVKPYRDNLLNFETYNVPPLKDSELAMKGYKMEPDGLKYAVSNPALNLSSKTYSERGKELDQMMWDAETNYIVGKLDEAGWQAAIDKWRKAGGDNQIKEYEAAYAAQKKK